MIAAMSPISSDKKSIPKKKLKILWDHHDIMISSFLLAKNGKTMELPWDSHPLALQSWAHQAPRMAGRVPLAPPPGVLRGVRAE